MNDEPRFTVQRRMILEYMVENLGVNTWIDMQTLREEAFPNDVVRIEVVCNKMIYWGLLKEKARRRYAVRYVRLTSAGRAYYYRRMKEKGEI